MFNRFFHYLYRYPGPLGNLVYKILLKKIIIYYMISEFKLYIYIYVIIKFM